MESTVKLQEPMAYMTVWIVLAIILLIAAIFLQVFFRIRRKRNGEEPNKIKIVKPPRATIPEIKRRHLGELEKIRTSISNGEINSRIAYQRMSKVIRHFVYDMTGVQVQKYTLYEIRQIKMPLLTRLIEDYYVPEFAEETVADAIRSLEGTRRVIERWH